ncbi:MAG: hypothetical protein OEV34_11335 [Gammaproteobacteria bacterium]|nr:hypothetical protein [Gammaproteobacteria bacterium]
MSDDTNRSLLCLATLKYMEWLPSELYRTIIERNGIAMPADLASKSEPPIGSGALRNAARALRESSVITEIEFRVILTSNLERKVEIMRQNKLI